MPADFRAATSSSHASGARDGFEKLTPELQAVASQRLTTAAIAYGGIWLLLFLGNYIQFIVKTGQFILPSNAWALRTLVAMLLSAAVILKTRKGIISPRNFVRAAAMFQILGALLIVQELWGWQNDLAGDLQRLGVTPSEIHTFVAGSAKNAAAVELVHPRVLLRYDGVNAVTTWLLLFPLIVPITPRRTMLLSFVSASTVPLVAGGSVLYLGSPEIVAPLVSRYLFDMVLPVYVVAMGAVFASHVVFGLTRDLSKARELGSYRLVELIGKGGMGEVWKAEHRLLARPAAVKLIRESTNGSSSDHTSEASRRFEREAQATAVLQSPHTIQVYDFGTAADGSFYYVMEYLDGLDLKTLVQKYGPLPASRVVHILIQACHSLWDAHATGLIHRDIKPANLFVGRRGQDHDFVKVLDFGLVKDVDAAAHDATQLTMEGIASGTPAFMAPEAARGYPADARADLYALGCVAYWLLTGHLVFEDRTPVAILMKHVGEAPVPPSQRAELDIPPALDQLVLDLLAKAPDDRPASADEVRQRLQAMLTKHDVPPWTREQAQRWWSVHLPDRSTPDVLPSPS
ncbi:MAG: hypothetical protein DHS20C21_15990 [Gemmatimonadota bacterium]|nr:MAG: hypothetical protein DHS20C21_15990 [Gemmatimonadota bacterium]